MDIASVIECENRVNVVITKLDILFEIISNLEDIYIDSNPSVIHVAFELKVKKKRKEYTGEEREKGGTKKTEKETNIGGEGRRTSNYVFLVLHEFCPCF